MMSSMTRASMPRGCSSTRPSKLASVAAAQMVLLIHLHQLALAGFPAQVEEVAADDPQDAGYRFVCLLKRQRKRHKDTDNFLSR